MSTFSRRRQLLLYLGLGIAGAGVATAWGGNSQKIPAAIANLPTPSSDDLPSPSGSSLPEFQGISQWFNSSPLAIADLQGSVILIQFWTFACINCQRTLPFITRWHQQYKADGLKVIGVHTPEFAFERDPNNIKQALRQHNITYPVPIDNDYKTWNAYGNGYWPHLFLADRQGIMRYDHIGEGAYDETEQMIQRLLRTG